LTNARCASKKAIGRKLMEELEVIEKGLLRYSGIKICV
jgi:hypothetical protein